ncbi:MAG TPA: FlgD immunoglobulin-like domain containing protein [bacterium]
MIAYHASGYPFYCADGGQRWTFYSIGGTPYVKIDGAYTEVGGLSSPGTMFPRYRYWATQRTPIHSPLFIDLTCSYDSLTNNGTVTALVTSDTTANVTGNIYFAVTENNIPYSWGGLTTVEHVCRDMLPSGTGTAVTIPASDTIIREQSFTINTAWNENNIYIVVWVQNTSTRLIYQAGLIRIQPKPDMEYFGLTYTEVSGNNDRVAEPGETIMMYVNAKNNGGSVYTGNATISTSDAYVTINSSTPQTTAINPGDVDTVLAVECAISGACPIDHIAEFLVDFGMPGDTSRARLMITDNPGFEDDIESGQGSWTHTGSNDQWHISTYRSHSPASAWYNGNDGSHTYPNYQVAQLVSPYFVVTPDSGVSFWKYFASEANWDYGYFELDNNCGWWRQFASYTGSQTSWTQVSFALAEYAGQTIRLRFRFISDSSTGAEGWYVDDLRVPMVFGVVENQNAHVRPYSLMLAPNPFQKQITIHYALSSKDHDAQMHIYDATGRLVKSFSLSSAYSIVPSVVTWYGDDEAGNQLPAGTYFIEISGENGSVTEKALLLR